MTDKVYVIGSVEPSPLPRVEHKGNALLLSVVGKSKVVVFKVAAWDPDKHPKGYKGLFIETPDKIDATDAKVGDVLATSNGKIFKVEKQTEKGVKVNPVDADSGEVKESYTVLSNSVSVAVVESGPSANTDHLITDLPPGTYIKHPKSGKRFEIGKHGNWTTVYPVDNNGVRQGKHTVLPPTSMVYVVPKSVSDSITQEQVDTVAAVAADLVPSTDAEPIGDKALEELLVSSWGDASNKVAEDLGIADSSAVKEAMAAYNIYNDTYFGELLGNPSLVTPPDYASQDSDKIISTLFDNLYVDGHDTEPLNLMKTRLAEVFGERFAKQQALAATPSIPDQLDEVLPSKLPKVPKKYQDGVGKDTKIVIEIGNARYIEKGQYGGGEVFVIKRVSPDGSSSVLGISGGIGKAKKLARTMSADHEQIDIVTHHNYNHTTSSGEPLYAPYLNYKDVKTGDVVVTGTGRILKIGEIIPPDPNSATYSQKAGQIEVFSSNGKKRYAQANSYQFLSLTPEEKTLAQGLWDSTAVEASASGTPLDEMMIATFAGESLRTTLTRLGRVKTETEVLRTKRENKWIPELQHGWSSDELLGSDWQTDAHPRLRALGWREIKPRQKDFVRYTNKYGQRLIISRDKSGKVTNISEEKLKFAMVQNTTTAKELHANLTEAIAQGADITDLDPRNNEHSVLRNDAAQQLVYDTALGRVNGVHDAVALGDQIVKTDAEYERELTGIEQTIIEKPNKADISAAPVGSEFEISGPMGPSVVATYVKRDDYKVGDEIAENGLARSAPVGTQLDIGNALWTKETDLIWRSEITGAVADINEFATLMTNGYDTTKVAKYEGDGLGEKWRLENSHTNDNRSIGDPIVDDATLAGMTGQIPNSVMNALGSGTAVDSHVYSKQKLTINKKTKAKIGTVEDYISKSGNEGIVQLSSSNPYPALIESPKFVKNSAYYGDGHQHPPGTYTETDPLTDVEGATLYALLDSNYFLSSLKAEDVQIFPGDPTKTAKEVASAYDDYLTGHVKMEVSNQSVSDSMTAGGTTGAARKRAASLLGMAPPGAKYVVDGETATKQEDGSWTGIDFQLDPSYSQNMMEYGMINAAVVNGATIEWNEDLNSGTDAEAKKAAKILGSIGEYLPVWASAKVKSAERVKTVAESERGADIELQIDALRKKEGTVKFKSTPFDLPLWDGLEFEAQSIDEIQKLAENLPPLGTFDAITDVPAFHSGGIVRDGLVLHQGGISAPEMDSIERRTRAKVLMEFDDDMTVKMIELGAENVNNPTPIKPGQGGSYQLHEGKAFVLYEGEKRIEYVAHDSAFSGKAPTSQRGRLSLFGYTPKEATERLQELGVVGPLQPEVPMTALMRGKRRVGNYVPLLPEYVRGEAELPKSRKRLTHGVTGGDKQAVVDSVLEVGALLSIEQRYHARFLDKIHTSSPSGDIRSGLDHAVFVGLGTHSACGSGSSLRFILKPSAYLVRDITLTDHDFGSAETRYGKYKKYLNRLQADVGEDKTSLYEPVSPAVRQRFLDNKPGGSAEYNLGPSVPLEDVEYVAVEPEYVEATQAKLDQMYAQGLLAEVPKVVSLKEYSDLANRPI